MISSELRNTTKLLTDDFRGLPKSKFSIGQTVQQVFISGILDDPEDDGKEFWSIGWIVGKVWNNPYVGDEGWSYAVLWSLVEGELRQKPHFEFHHESDLLLVE